MFFASLEPYYYESSPMVIILFSFLFLILYFLISIVLDLTFKFNKSQKTILFISMIILFIMILFPPWATFDYLGAKTNYGYRFIFYDHSLKSYIFEFNDSGTPIEQFLAIDFIRLLSQYVLLIAATTCLLLRSKDGEG